MLAAIPIVINEVLYDPDGADAGREFVELAAALGSPPGASLAGWRLETGNGATGAWRVAWTGGPADSLVGGLFVVGEGAVEPRPDAVADLDLQNGPDAVRLRAPDGGTDVVGWGEPLPPGFFEGSPAEDVVGASLARTPDGRDTGNNAADLVAAEPGPGDFNAPERAIAVESVRWPPAGLAPGAVATFEWRVRNAGRAAFAGEVRIGCAVHPAEVLATGRVEGLSPGAAVWVRATVAPPDGVHLPRSDPPAPDAGPPWRGARADLVVTETFPRPEPGEFEWIEVRALGPAVDLSALVLEDEAGTRGAPAGTLAAGSFAVLAADSAAVAARWRRAARVVSVSPWPALNHTAAGGLVAERIGLFAGAGSAAGAPAAEAVIPGGLPAGVSWELASVALDGRRVESWRPSVDPAGATPGLPNSLGGDRPLPGAAPGAIVLAPSPFHPARDGTVLVVLRGAAAAAELTVHDASGREVARLAPWAASGGERRAVWDGRAFDGSPAPLGLYLVCARGRGFVPRPAPLVLVR